MADSSVQKWLQQIGCTSTMYPSSLGRVRSTATWTPATQWAEGDVKGTFFGRYGFYAVGTNDETAPDARLYSAGNYVGERMASPFPTESQFLAVMRKLTGDPSLILGYQDLEDLKLVKDPGANDVVYNVRIEPAIAAAQAAIDAAGTPGLPPVDPPPANGDAATILALKAQLATANGQITALKAAAATALKFAKRGLAFVPASGAGKYAQNARDNFPPIIDALSGS